MEQVKRFFFQKKRKLNNKGVTLVELLVSITILSIVVGAFYSCFVLAAKTNAKAKSNHKATTLAQNLMENIKAEDMDSLMGQIVWPTYTVAQEDGSVRTVQNFRLVSQSGYDVGNVLHFPPEGETYATSNDGGITTNYNPGLDDYQFCLRNVKMENTSFDALVTVKASEAVDGAGETIGTKDMVHIPSMDSNYDAVVSNAAVYDKEVLSYFESKGVYDVLTPGNITRTITVDVDKDLKLSGQIGYEVKATYRYECEDELYEVTDLAFSNEGDMSKALRNVFIFYKPHFSWVDTDDWTEKIVVNNPDDYPLDLYLIKQQPTDDETDLGHEENMEYRVDININEPYSSTDEHSSIRIKTNLGYAFKNPTIPMTLYKQGVYTVNGASVSNYEDFFQMTALTNKSEAELLFDVNIKIYAGDANREVDDASAYAGETVLAELNGTLRN